MRERSHSALETNADPISLTGAWSALLHYNAAMRTTVEISEAQRVALTAIAAERGLRGFSPIVQEAIDAYLERGRARSLDALLALRGSLSDESADRIEQIVSERRTGEWRGSSSSTPTS